MLKSIANRFHVSEDAVGRHRRHMRTAMLKAEAAAEKPDLIYGQTLIDEVKAIKADAERLQLEAEGRRDIRAALQAYPTVQVVSIIMSDTDGAPAICTRNHRVCAGDFAVEDVRCRHLAPELN